METIMTLSILEKKQIIDQNHKERQFVLFTREELEILNKVKPTYRGIQNIKKLKHLFHGQLVK